MLAYKSIMAPVQPALKLMPSLFAGLRKENNSRVFGLYEYTRNGFR